MGHYRRGDVVLAPVSFEDKRGAKTRPAIVIAAGSTGEVHICPVSSKPPSDAPCIPISLDDFSEGGLDMFGESYVLTSRVRTIRSGEVIGKRGQLTLESIDEILTQVPSALLPNDPAKKKPGPGSKSSRKVH
jgi:mRNA-degrading endonuclease toxin of MazEF toxin-antitoxin module